MKVRQFAVVLSCTTIFFYFFSPVYAGVDWRINKTLQLQGIPLDFTISRSGAYTFVLVDTGEILIYDSVGTLSASIAVGKHIDKILTGPNDNSLLVCSKEKRELQVISFVIEEEIDTEGSPYLGPEDAPVELIIFTDFQCPYCAKVAPTLNQLHEINGKDLKVVFKNFPLSFHKMSFKAATAALIAGESGKFWLFHDQLMAQSDSITDESILEIAVDLGFNKAMFEEKMKDPRWISRIQKDIQDGRKAGVTGTPTLLINGKPQKKRSILMLQKSIDWELDQLNQKRNKQ